MSLRLALVPRRDPLPAAPGCDPGRGVDHRAPDRWADRLADGPFTVKAFHVFIREPLTDPWALQEVLLKSTPLMLISIGLIFCFRANRWNIGAEGQFLLGGFSAAASPLPRMA